MSDIELKFNAQGLIPAILQDDADGRVLMLVWMDREAIRMTRTTGFTHFYSRKRKAVRKKGEKKGNTQKVKSILHDCDGDVLLIRVEPEGATCHTGGDTCFFTDMNESDTIAETETPTDGNILSRIYEVIREREADRPEGSYVASLFEKGESAILKKIGEEAVELVIGCKNRNRDEIVYEAADLWFHTMVAMAQYDVPPDEIFRELKKRFK